MVTCEPMAFSFFRRLEMCTHTTLISASLSQPQTRSMIRSALSTILGLRMNSSITWNSRPLSRTLSLPHRSVPDPVSSSVSPHRSTGGV